MAEQRSSVYIVVVVGVFVTCLIVANIISVKLVNIAGLLVPAGVIVFVVIYVGS